ncbi:MAG: FtsQ-type POTRA domain-containing protein [Kiritimatiellales bacterium]|nr:FtsQ-type POTRA domain-containing protein [Kiritimatiellales bacterium]
MAARRKSRKAVKPQYVRTKANSRRNNASSAFFKRMLTVLLLVVALGGIFFGLHKGMDYIGTLLFAGNPAFEIQHLIITSDGRLTEEKIREYTGLSEGQNLFATDFETIEENFAQVSDVESVYLERQLPHTLIVKVKERVPVACIIGKEKRVYPFVVDRFGYVLPPRQSAKNLPVIKGLENELRLGEEAGNPDVEIALEILAICESTDYLRKYIRITSMDIKYSDFIDMRLEDGARVRMPRFSLRKKLQNLASAIKIAQDRGERYREWDLTLDSPRIPAKPY